MWNLSRRGFNFRACCTPLRKSEVEVNWLVTGLLNHVRILGAHFVCMRNFPFHFQSSVSSRFSLFSLSFSVLLFIYLFIYFGRHLFYASYSLRYALYTCTSFSCIHPSGRAQPAGAKLLLFFVVVLFVVLKKKIPRKFAFFLVLSN